MRVPEAGRVLALAIFAGEIMLESGAEISRVEETIGRILAAYGLTGEAWVTPTGIFASAGPPGEPPATGLRRVRRRGLALWRVSAVNALSRGLAAHPEPVATVQERLNGLLHAPALYPPWLHRTAGLLSGAAATLLLGGTTTDLLPALAANLLVQLVLTALARLTLPAAMTHFAGAAAASAAALVFHLAGWPLHVSLVIAGGIIALMPGLVFTAAVRDGLAGDLLSSVTGAAEAALSAAALAAGVGTALYVYLRLGGRL